MKIANNNGPQPIKIHWHTVLEAYMTGRPLEGRIVKMDPNGVTVDLGGMEAFIPTKLLLLHGESLEMLSGKTIKAIVIKVSALSSNILMSRIELYQEQDLRKRTEVYSSLSTDTIYHGRVKSVMPYGVFVDFEDVCGMIPLKEMSWDYIAKPSDVFKEGDPIDIKVLDIDAANKKIVLSHRHTKPNPWHSMSHDIIRKDAELNCEVKSIWKSGIFVSLPEGINGIVGTDDMPMQKVPKHLKEGDTIRVKIKDIDYNAEKFTLQYVNKTFNNSNMGCQDIAEGCQVKGTIIGVNKKGQYIVAISKCVFGLLNHTDEMESYDSGASVNVYINKINSDTKTIELSINGNME